MKCYRPKGHPDYPDDCGVAITDEEFDQGILYGRCGPEQPLGAIYARGSGTTGLWFSEQASEHMRERLELSRLTRRRKSLVDATNRRILP